MKVKNKGGRPKKEITDKEFRYLQALLFPLGTNNSKHLESYKQVEGYKRNKELHAALGGRKVFSQHEISKEMAKLCKKRLVQKGKRGHYRLNTDFKVFYELYNLFYERSFKDFSIFLTSAYFVANIGKNLVIFSTPETFKDLEVEQILRKPDIIAEVYYLHKNREAYRTFREELIKRFKKDGYSKETFENLFEISHLIVRSFREVVELADSKDQDLSRPAVIQDIIIESLDELFKNKQEELHKKKGQASEL
jgi:hypothetical protein